MADGSYTHKCRIGNWSEDYELEQLRMKDYLQRKSNGELLVTKHQAKMNHSLQRVQLSTSNDGHVHFGDSVLLYSVKTQGILSNDLGDLVMSSGAKAYSVTTSTLIKHPAARNVYIIEPVQVQEGNVLGDVVRFGMPFRLRAHEKLTGSQALYLHSQPVSPLSASKCSRHQEVLLHSAQNSYDTVWKIAHKDKNFRFEMEGQPVPHSVELIILHSQTRQALSSDLIKSENDFGIEYEVCSKTFLVAAKNQTMKHEFLGEITPETASRHELRNNYWAFIVQSPTEDNTIINQ